MVTTADQLTPETLQAYFGSGLVTRHRVSNAPLTDIVIDGPGQKISVSVMDTSLDLDTTTLRRVTTGLDQRGGETWQRITFDARGMHTEAYGLVVSIVQAVRGGATFSAAAGAALTNMKALLAAKPRIPEQRQVGLFGELILVRHLLAEHSERAVMDWWLGPLAEQHDFAFPHFDAEIKTTLGEKRIHVIHGAGQLEPTMGRPLWLVSIQVTRAGGDPSGRRLAQVIGEIREHLVATRPQFDAALENEGWDDADEAMYPARYVLRNPPAAYLVDDDFPALTPGRLRAAVPHSEMVSDITYRVDMSARQARIPRAPLDSFVTPTDIEEF